MTTETPDPFDTDLQELFAGIQPPADFEDRLVNTIRQHRRMRLAIPGPIIKAALAAAAVLAVGTVGYYGNRAITGKPLLVADDSSIQAVEAPPPAPATLAPSSNSKAWDFGGESNSAQNRSDRKPGDANIDLGFQNPLSHQPGVSRTRELKSPVAAYSIKSDINGGKQPGDRSPDTDQLGDETGRELTRVDRADTRTETSTLPLTLSPGDTYTGYTKISGGAMALGTGASVLHRQGGQDASSGDGHADWGIQGRAPLSVLSPTDEKRGQSPLSGATDDKRGDAKRGQPPLSGASDIAAADGAVTVSGAPPGVLHAPNSQEAGGKGGQVPLTAALPVNPASPVTGSTTAPVVDDRKIIRTGSMEFEVDRFDAAQMQITKIVGELGGFVGATDSTKLPNGKVRGSISVRVPPERLDTLVLSLRALGDLKSQQITAADITKEYTDLQSELTADRAMQERLLDLIHNGKGTVKDLLAAENELGNWRSKIEKAEGMIRYYNGQVALSTLAITLSERDIQTPATAVETETADVGIEADDVEKARTSALKAIDDVKGRVVEAELKRFDAGQLAARLVADVPPDSAGAVIDQLKLLGKVARLEINRQQCNSDGTTAATVTTPLKTERKPTRLLISIYNLANIAPRRTTNVSLAAIDVEAAYNALATAAKSNGGRVVTSALNRGDPVKATGSLVLEFPPDKFESAMTALHAQGDVLKLTLTENLDTRNSTEAKAGLTVQLISLAAIPARENIVQTLAVTDVPTAYQAVVNAASAAHARVQSAQLNEQDRQNVTADLQLEIPRTAEADFDKALAAAGGSIARTSNRSAEAEGTVDSKVSLHLSIVSADHLAPRETTRLQVETADVDKSAADAQAAAVSAGGRVLEASVTKDHGKGLARVILDLPLDKTGDVLRQIRGEGTVRGIDASRDSQAPAGMLAHAQIFVEFMTGEAIVADQTGPWASIRQGLSTSITGLLWSLQWVIVGMCLIVPWVGIGWIAWKMKLRMTKSRPAK